MIFKVKWPNGISIDSVAERVYWVDAALDFIASVNLDGDDFKKVINRLLNLLLLKNI